MENENGNNDKQRNIGPISIILIMLYFMLLTLLALYAIVQLWPPAQTGEAAVTAVKFFTQTVKLTSDGRLMLIVIIAGALGSCVHVIRSLSSYIGHRKLKWSWLPMYILRPFAGAILALVIYLALRGGLFSTNAGIQDTSTFGFAAIATLAGMFSEQAVLKLKDVAEQVFKEPTPGKDALHSHDDSNEDSEHSHDESDEGS